jgi:hypothetical protein
MGEYILALRLNGWRFYGLFLQSKMEKALSSEKLVNKHYHKLRGVCEEASSVGLLIYLLTYLFTYLLTPWSRVILEELNGSQLVKKFPTFYGIRVFITAVTSARHLSLF